MKQLNLLIGAALLLLLKDECGNRAVGFSVSSLSLIKHNRRIIPISTALSAKGLSAKGGGKKKKKSGGGGATTGVKGFGSTTSASTAEIGIDLDRSKDALSFYDFLTHNGAGDNLKRTALGFFPLAPGGPLLRGVVALKDMKKGDVIIRIPYELAVNLGAEGDDPTIPGTALLKSYCRTLGEGDPSDTLDRSPYYKMLPGFLGDDCMGSTDFFSSEALDALQAPLVSEETINRRKRTQDRFDRDVLQNFPRWTDGDPVSEEHLRWAVWLITSRVLTVQGTEEENRSYRLLIPYLDMCNHDRSSPHVLTGRAVPGGELKVVAGANIKAGKQVNICYGGGVAGNDRFLQDYGFLDGDEAFNIVAQQLLGRRRLVEGSNSGRHIASVDREATIEQLHRTTQEQDEELLATTKDPALRAAISYRVGVKKALAKYDGAP